jgi:hypothetical protein
VDGLDVQQAEAGLVAPIEKFRGRPVVGATGVGVADLAVKNSTKRLPAWGPRAAISAGTGALVSVNKITGRFSESGPMASGYSRSLMNDKGGYNALFIS